MDQYVGLDVSLKETCVCVIDGEGNRVWQGKCSSSPDDIEEVIRRHAPRAVRVALETGPLCVWHWHALRQSSVPVVCIHARHAKAALMMQLNKTDQTMHTAWRRSFAVVGIGKSKSRAWRAIAFDCC